MKIILAILFFASVVFADTQHTFTIPIEVDGYGAKTNVATWAGARDGASSNVSLPSADTLAVYSWCSDLATDTFKVGRAFLWSDTINSQSYVDSLQVTAGNSVRLDSATLFITAFHGVVTAGCTNQLYMSLLDSCSSQNYPIGESYTLLDFNDIYSSPLTSKFFLADSFPIDTNTFGMATGGPTVINFALTDRTELDDLECLINFSQATKYRLGICITSCYDQSNTQPAPLTDYNSKVSLYALENAGANPYMIVYWTEVLPTPDTDDGWQSWGIWNAWGKW